MAEYRVSVDPTRKLPNWRRIVCPRCPPNDVNLVDAHVPDQTLHEQGAESIMDLSDLQIRRLALAHKASIPAVCHDCEDD